MSVRRIGSIVLAAGLCLFAASLPAVATTTATTEPSISDVHVGTQGVAFRLGNEHVSIILDGAGAVHVQALPDGVTTDQPTLLVAPHPAPATVAGARVQDAGATLTLASDRLVAVWHKQADTLDIEDAQRRPLLTLDLAALQHGLVRLRHADGEAFYGVGGYTIHEPVTAGLLRDGKLVAKAGEQGHAGAPFVWSTAGYGVLVDSDGAVFDLAKDHIEVSGLSKLAVDAYLMVGNPSQLFAELADLSGHAPLFPKWSMGFLNSQWGIDEQELLSIVHTYRAKHIPIDGFILDFDWKAWGEPWGEFRWNAKKFPDAPSGKLKAELDKLGIHLAGIMKPRVHVDTPEGRYATAHHLWLPGEKTTLDYFSHKPVRDIDFDKPAARAWWFNDALKHSFDTGIVGWWNDEADTTDSNTQFLNMQRATYDGQRAYSKLRVWSINRDFWLGAQRYAYGLWSGDIDTGFASMAAQRTRMLSAIEVGEMNWGMDGGGFNGHPSDENYARWIEFGAFTPIFRVHGTLGEKRQPWRYGAVAEAAATRAIRLRYALIPYIYAYQRSDYARGVGLVRPLTFGWPDDPKVRNDVDAWMFGQWLLVSPVVEQGQTTKRIYLPAGTWTDWFTGKLYTGEQTIDVPVDAKTWRDIPLFIRSGAIIPTQPVMDYVGQHPVKTVTVQVFPTDHDTRFDYYDDDGKTYAYEKGVYFLQTMTTRKQGDAIDFKLAAPRGSYKPVLHDYLLAIHGGRAQAVTVNGRGLAGASTLDALKQSAHAGWIAGHDRFGDVTWVKVPAGEAADIRIETGAP